MAMVTGQITSYDSTATLKRNVEDMIQNVSIKQVPLLKLVAGLAQLGGAQAPSINTLSNECKSTKYEWLEDTLAPTKDQLGAAVADTTGVTVNVDDGTVFRTGSVILVDDEEMWVASVATNALTVVRGFAGTTAATHADDSPVEIIGIAMLDGADAPTARFTEPTNPYNHTQIFEKPIQVSGTDAAVARWGIDNEYEYQLGKKFTELAIQLERALIQGRRAAGSKTAARAMGGFPQYITDNVTNLSSAPLTEQAINDLLALIYADVGLENMPEDLLMKDWLKRKISSFYAPYGRMQMGERIAGMKVDQIETEFGVMSVHLNYWIPASILYAVNLNFFGVGALNGRGFFEQPLAIGGDYKKGEIIGEYTCELKNDKAHGKLYGVSTSS